MKSIILVMIALSLNLFAQQFQVQKITGKVYKIQGTQENSTPVKIGDKLNGSDLLITEANSIIQLNNNGNLFLLRGNSALGLNNIRKISVDDLLLQLAAEEIRSIPQSKKKGIGRTTAVYGSELSNNKTLTAANDLLGLRKLNGAKQLSEEGYTNSAIIVAKETFRKHPETQKLLEYRIYFASQLADLNLFEEAAGEFNKIQKLDLTQNQKNEVAEKLKEINLKLASN